MSKCPEKSKTSVTFKHEITVEARAAEFQPLASLRSLDVARLSKGDHKIEIGFVKGSCCSRLVRAVIRDGTVTDVEVEPCDETKPLSPELIGMAREAHRRLTGGDATFQPAPVADFIEAVSRGFILEFCIWIITWWGWVLVCQRWIIETTALEN